jgi:hypothetical protein
MDQSQIPDIVSFNIHLEIDHVKLEVNSLFGSNPLFPRGEGPHPHMHKTEV